jgi:hypothetical protein
MRVILMVLGLQYNVTIEWLTKAINAYGDQVSGGAC